MDGNVTGEAGVFVGVVIAEAAGTLRAVELVFFTGSAVQSVGVTNLSFLDTLFVNFFHSHARCACASIKLTPSFSFSPFGGSATIKCLGELFSGIEA